VPVDKWFFPQGFSTELWRLFHLELFAALKSGKAKREMLRGGLFWVAYIGAFT
jgi:hypothetical protein